VKPIGTTSGLTRPTESPDRYANGWRPFVDEDRELRRARIRSCRVNDETAFDLCSGCGERETLREFMQRMCNDCLGDVEAADIYLNWGRLR